MTGSTPRSRAARSRPIVTIAAKDVTTPEIAAAIKDLESRAVATGRFNGPVDVTVSKDKQVAQIAIPIKGDGADDVSNAGRRRPARSHWWRRPSAASTASSRRT